MIGVGEKVTLGATVGGFMALSGSPEGFVMLGAVGGVIGHVIWCERNPEKAAPLTGAQHAFKVLRNMIVSAFLGAMLFLGALQFGMNKEPMAYFAAGMFGVFSIDSAIFMWEAARDVVRTFAGRIAAGGTPPEGPK